MAGAFVAARVNWATAFATIATAVTECTNAFLAAVLIATAVAFIIATTDHSENHRDKRNCGHHKIALHWCYLLRLYMLARGKPNSTAQYLRLDLLSATPTPNSEYPPWMFCLCPRE